MSKAFGNDKPDVLRRVELALWRVLLNVATGRDTMYNALAEFFNRLPQNELVGLTTEEREFFCTGM